MPNPTSPGMVIDSEDDNAIAQAERKVKKSLFAAVVFLYFLKLFHGLIHQRNVEIQKYTYFLPCSFVKQKNKIK